MFYCLCGNDILLGYSKSVGCRCYYICDENEDFCLIKSINYVSWNRLNSEKKKFWKTSSEKKCKKFKEIAFEVMKYFSAIVKTLVVGASIFVTKMTTSVLLGVSITFLQNIGLCVIILGLLSYNLDKVMNYYEDIPVKEPIVKISIFLTSTSIILLYHSETNLLFLGSLGRHKIPSFRILFSVFLFTAQNKIEWK